MVGMIIKTSWVQLWFELNKSACAHVHNAKYIDIKITHYTCDIKHV